ncbi:unnamed protein product [Moneuplotes crassus]|uniref:PITH domain-containing protein n=1 Tax=Euplotes crassus TaxID=5936 RepID=A0AAD1XXX6_EUPCR|nr:unnamed protein product [Moneuplotes crassus]
MKHIDPHGIDLYGAIELEGLQAFNEEEEGSTKFVIKPREEMLEESKGTLRSDDDVELVIKIPFTSKVKIKAITIIGGEDGTAPKSIKLYPDLASVDFSILEDNEPAQEIDLIEDNSEGRVDYPVKLTKFQSVGTLTIGIDQNYGADNTEIKYIGFKGENLNQKAQAVITVYESRANLADHKNPMMDEMPKDV